MREEKVASPLHTAGNLCDELACVKCGDLVCAARGATCTAPGCRCISQKLQADQCCAAGAGGNDDAIRDGEPRAGGAPARAAPRPAPVPLRGLAFATHSVACADGQQRSKEAGNVRTKQRASYVRAKETKQRASYVRAKEVKKRANCPNPGGYRNREACGECAVCLRV